MTHARTGTIAAAWAAALALVVVALVPVAPHAQVKPDVQLKAAIDKEVVDGDLKAAIEMYRKLAEGADRAVAAKALLRMGQCYDRLGDTEARKAYERIVAQFADQKDVADEARKRLGTRGAAAPVETGLVERHVWSSPAGGVSRTGGVSADGRLAAVVELTKDGPRLFLLDLVTGQERTVTEKTRCYSVSLAPDARQIACGWMADGTGTVEIRAIQVGDGSMRTIWRGEGPANRVHGWSPDGKYILASKWVQKGVDWDLILVSVADGSAKVLKTGGGVPGDGTNEPRFSPDGRYIVRPAGRIGADGKPVAAYRHTLHIMPVVGDTEVPLVRGAPSEAHWSPAWTPDGKRIAFISDRSGEPAAWAVTVVDGKPQGEPERLMVSAGSQRDSLIGFASDGTLYGLRSVATSDVFLAELDAQSGKLVAEPTRVNQTHVGRTGGLVSWSPDGQRLAYYWLLNSGFTGIVHNMVTGEDRELPPHASPLVAGWFPGGRTLLAGNKRVDVTTGRQDSVPGLDRLAVPPEATGALSHDGKSIYYSAGDGDPAKNNGRLTVHLIRHDVESGQKRAIYRTTSPASGLHSIAVSPDDRLVAFGEVVAVTGGGTSVKVISAEGGEAREVLSNAGLGAAWSASGRDLLLSRSGTAGKSELVWVPVGGGPPRPAGLRVGGSYAVHPDGRHIAFVDGSDPQDEIVAIRNLLAAQKSAR